MAQRYAVRFVTYAEAQRRSLPPAGRQALDRKVHELEEDPYRDVEFKPSDGTWLSTFRESGEWGVILYLIADQIVTVTVLRLTWVGG
jgi:hypothetical protein